MRQRDVIISLIAVIGLVLFAVFLVVPPYQHLQRLQKEGHELSRMMSVRIIVASALSDYYRTNGAYPESLENLPAGLLHWGDEGSSAPDLKLLHYNTTSNTFTLVWARSANHRLFVGGRTGELYWDKKDLTDQVRVNR